MNDYIYIYIHLYICMCVLSGVFAKRTNKAPTIITVTTIMILMTLTNATDDGTNTNDNHAIMTTMARRRRGPRAETSARKAGRLAGKKCCSCGMSMGRCLVRIRLGFEQRRWLSLCLGQPATSRVPGSEIYTQLGYCAADRRAADCEGPGPDGGLLASGKPSDVSAQHRDGQGAGYQLSKQVSHTHRDFQGPLLGPPHDKFIYIYIYVYVYIYIYILV